MMNTNREYIIFKAYGKKSLMLHSSEIRLATSNLRMGPVAVVVIVGATIVNHGGDVGVLVLQREGSQRVGGRGGRVMKM